LIRRLGRVPADEMDRTFNNGLGMILVADRKQADGVARMLKSMGEAHAIIGEIRKGPRGVSYVG
jgi:phosphoribosylformylglycinamidine cyclo-ligase